MIQLREISIPFFMIGLLSACSTSVPHAALPHAIPQQWQASLPSGNTPTTTSLSLWWQQQTDPFLAALIEAAQVASPSVAQAFSRIQAARLELAAAHSAQLPSLDAAASASRAHNQIGLPPASTLQASLQSAWEVDLFHEKRNANLAASAQLEGSQAQWHDARTLVAAEVANLYFDYSTCQQLRELAQADSQSYGETARISLISAKHGLLSNAMVAQTQASAAQANIRLIQQETQCGLSLKALVALTGMEEPALKARLTQALAQPVQARPLAVSAVPAQMLRQRPDIFAAERNVATASLRIDVAEAKQYPSLSLNGSIGIVRQANNGPQNTLHSWSIGPLTLSYPLFDGGQRQANIHSAKAQYQEAVAAYTSKVRVAVKEVEEALLNLHSADTRQREADQLSQSYAQTMAAITAKHRQGLASLLELEDARRLALTAQSTQLSLQLERNRAWVALYRALGGGWDAKATPARS